jgi:hypothetical protein
LQRFSNKNRKEKRKELEKEERAAGITLAWVPKMAHDPFPLSSRNGTLSLSISR